MIWSNYQGITVHHSPGMERRIWRIAKSWIQEEHFVTVLVMKQRRISIPDRSSVRAAFILGTTRAREGLVWEPLDFIFADVGAFKPGPPGHIEIVCSLVWSSWDWHLPIQGYGSWPEKVGLPQVEEFKYLGGLFSSEGMMELEIDRQIGAAPAVTAAPMTQPWISRGRWMDRQSRLSPRAVQNPRAWPKNKTVKRTDCLLIQRKLMLFLVKSFAVADFDLAPCVVTIAENQRKRKPFLAIVPSHFHIF